MHYEWEGIKSSHFCLNSGGEKLKVKIDKIVEDVVNEKIENLGFQIEYIEFVKEGSQNILRIVIDKKMEL